MIDNPIEKTEEAEESTKGAKNGTVEKVKEKTKSVGKVLVSSRVFWSALSSVVTLFSPTIGKAIAMVSSLLLGV